MTENIEQKRAYLTIPEAQVEFAGMSRQWYRDRINDKTFDKHKGGGKGSVFLISRDSLERYFETGED